MRFHCNCSRSNIVVLGTLHGRERALGLVPEDEQLGPDRQGSQIADLRKVIDAAQRDLRKIELGLDDKIDALRKVDISLETVDDLRRQQDEVDLGIVLVRDTCLDRLKMADDSPNERWARLDLASEVAAVNLQALLQEEQPLTKDMWKRLHAAVEDVATYGSAAVMLWKLIRAYRGDLEALKEIGAISKQQKKILSSLIKNSEQPFLELRSFERLEKKHQKVFLAAAKFCSRNYVNLPEFFTEDDCDNDALSMQSWDRAFDSFTRLEGVHALDQEEEKQPEPPNLDAFFMKLGNLEPTMDSETAHNRTALGILRAQVIGLFVGIPAPSILKGTITADKFERLEEYEPTLVSYDGAVYYLFESLKQTIDLNILCREKKLSKQLLEKLALEIKARPQFLYALKKVNELAALSPEDIALIYRVAQHMPAEDAANLKKEYPLGRWFQPERVRTPSVRARVESAAYPPDRDRGYSHTPPRSEEGEGGDDS